jgi:predicted transposase YdaD
MSQMDKIPIFIRKTVFEKLFNIAEYSNMTKADKHMYNAALKQKWDAQNKLDYAREEGIKEGLQQGRMEERAIAEAEKSVEKLKMATEFKKLGISAKEIAGIVGLPQDVVEQL